MAKRISCCRNCNDREIGCHGSCERYLEEKAEHDKEKETVRKLQAASSQAYGFERERYGRTRQVNYKSVAHVRNAG